MSLSVWVVVLRIAWFAGYAQNGESFPSARQRAQVATQHLTQLAAEHGSVLLVGHGIMNRLLGRALRLETVYIPSCRCDNRILLFRVQSNGFVIECVQIDGIERILGSIRLSKPMLANAYRRPHALEHLAQAINGAVKENELIRYLVQP
ncbi:MAG: histidine phosphatase family protein [Gammaproteobacteria bacterium]|nr:histidine phosphatase family protein [Gammaproteobacteria bacterium]MBU1724109.1 histidine phosphatase family protein [Gammaproteobacteria bacterium]MBU2006815.1 histidine phosphatase family protein [Gammaproteobacteria bacterium]